MGIPKFYRWTSERYPCLYEKIREYQIPEFDNLYLDMNGIIHNCSHPNDEDVHLRIPEENIFRDIFHYIDFLFRMIKPCRVFFMAIDGVAPRAKMNQQRGRRFRSARVAEEQEAEALRQGEKLPNEERFDSNCITPGTEFMARLHEQLKYFVAVKVTTDPLWQRKGVKVYLSGHDVPGEGEHKIMDFIRHIRSQPQYDPETRHCLYGLDADLMMLGLSTHELRFSLLREEVKFTRPKKNNNNNKNGRNQKQKKIKPKVANESVVYDLTNVSVFSYENPPDVPDSILRPPEYVKSTPPALTDKSYADAISVISSIVSNVEPKIDNAANIPASQAQNVVVPGPPPPDDHNAKGDYKAPLPEKTTFFLLHLSLFRDYLDEEFKELRANLENHPRIVYNLECLIDDWILMNILVGNDFVPHLPNLHIVKGALPMLYRTYMDVLPTLDGYLNENGILNLPRFESFIKRLSQFDLDQFRDTYDDMKYKASKTGKNIVLGEKMFSDFIFEDHTPFEEEELEPVCDELRALARRTEDEIFGDIKGGDGDGTMCKDVFPETDDFFAVDDTEEFRLEFMQHKRNYYLTKCEFKKVDRTAVHDFAKEYVRAIQWVLLYYYKGVSSWGWFYPSHYAPYASDLRSFGDFHIEFAIGQPFNPFEQLLAVLPSQSKKLLPNCYQWLMTDDISPILEYYPKKFEQDLNGKRQDWEAVVLIPFIDEKKLLTAMEKEARNLSEEEVFRNSRGSLLCHSYTPESTGPIKSHRDIFPEIAVSHVRINMIREVLYNSKLLPKGLHPKTDIKKIYQGFPSLKSKSFTSCICKAEVKVFEFYAREESLILSLEEQEDELDGLKLGKKILGKTIWVNWPHLECALVSSIYTRRSKYILGRDNVVIKDPKTTDDAAKKTFDVMAKGIVERHLKFRGIKLGQLNVIMMARIMEGRKIRCNSVGKVVIESQWTQIEQPFALKTAIYEERVTEMFYMDNATAKSYLDLFRIGDQVFYLGDKLFGAMGVVVGHDKGSGSVIVDLTVPKNTDESNFKLKTGLKQLKSQDFFPPYIAASKCHISSFALSRLTGRVLVSVEKPRKPSKKSSWKKKQIPESGSLSDSNSSESSEDDDFPALEPEIQKLNIGLDLKFNKTNMEVRGYTSKRDGQWHYSANTVKLVNEYVSKFPYVVEILGRADKSKDVYNAADLFPADPRGKTMEIVNWLEDRGVRNLPRIPTNCNVLDDDDIDMVWNHVIATTSEPDLPIAKQWTARPNLLYKPGLDKGCIAPIPRSQFALLDRVICVDRGASIPLGLRGTVVGIQAPPKTTNDESDESFKSTSSDALNALIIMCDPVTDIFDTVNAGAQRTTGDLTELTGSLAKLLGVNGMQALDSPKQQQNNIAPKPKPKPKLVKLFPYQVINLTQGATDLRQDLKKAPVPNKLAKNTDRSQLHNGTAIVPLRNYSAAVTSNKNNQTVTVLQRPGAERSKGVTASASKNLPEKREPVVTLPWPPKPMGTSTTRSITVAQLFAGQQQNTVSQVPKDILKLKPTQILKKTAPAEALEKASKSNTKSQSVSKPTDKKRQPAFVNHITEATNKPSVQRQEQRGIGTKVFVNSSLHPKNQSKNCSENTVKAQEEEISATKNDQKGLILNLLCQPRNMEKVNAATATTTPTTIQNEAANSPASNGHQAKHEIPPQYIPAQPFMFPVGNPQNQGQYMHPVMYVNGGNIPPNYFVPTPYPVMPGRNPYASAFMPQPPYHHSVNFPPPPPPQHWTNATPANYHQHRMNNQQTFRQKKGTRANNVFVPLQVSRSMAVNDPENVPSRRKENEFSEPEPIHVVSTDPPPQSLEVLDTSIPAAATNSLKALLGVTTNSPIESVPHQKKSRIAANFSLNFAT